MRKKCAATVVAGLAMAAAVWPAAAAAQDPAERVARLVAEPARIVVGMGDTAHFNVTAYDEAGRVVEDVQYRFAASRTALLVRDGTVVGRTAGEHRIAVSVVVPNPPRQVPMSIVVHDPPPGMPAGAPVILEIPVEVTWPPIARVGIEADPGRLYAGTTIHHRAAGYHADGSRRPEARVRWTSSDPAIATVDAFGDVTAHAAGRVAITAEIDGTRGAVEYDVAPFPAARLEIEGGQAAARTGDVLEFTARAYDADGRPVPDLPVTWSYTFRPVETEPARGAAGEVRDGRFVGEVPGVYTILATAGPLASRQSVELHPRGVVHRVHMVGHGRVNHALTRDFWVFEGVDGRDYAITGSAGFAYVWDVTDPSNIVRTDSIFVGARAVNDVKVSPDARYAVLSREGAADRRNGVVLLDLSNPRNPTVASRFTEQLTGGVHNVFPTDDYLFALSGGQRYVIIDVRDIYNPRYVSDYNHPDSRIHDIWVHDGIAYSSEWETGVVVVDVGNGRWGGTIENPVFVRTIRFPGMMTHTTFPYHQESTGRFYLFVTDEIWPRVARPLEGFADLIPYDPETGEGGRPAQTAGYLQIIDFTDPDDPRMVARYEMDEYGTHNPWVEDDVLYVGYYEGGMRAVDVSGELMGDLRAQGREMSVFKPYDPVGYIANAPMVWSAMPFKGHVFLSDANSGLWAVRLEPHPAQDVVF